MGILSMEMGAVARVRLKQALDALEVASLPQIHALI